MHSLWFVQWDFTRRDHPGNLGRVSGSGPVNWAVPNPGIPASGGNPSSCVRAASNGSTPSAHPDWQP